MTRGAYRGFASWTPERRREAAARGGRAAHASGKGHAWTKDEAAAAGRLGGIATVHAREERERARADALADMKADDNAERLARFGGGDRDE